MAKFFKFPFGITGDRAVIPDEAQPSQVVSYEAGFTPPYELAQPNPAAYDIPRDSSNELYYQMTLALQQYQVDGFPDFVTTADNLGVPYPYNYNAICRFDDGANGVRLYRSLVNSNVSLPTDIETWEKLPVVISGTSAGTANALTLNITQNYEIFNAGDLVKITASLNNLAATTLQVGLGAAIAVNKVTSAGIVPLDGGEIVAAGSYDFEFNGSVWILKNPTASQDVILYSQVSFLPASTQNIGSLTKVQPDNIQVDSLGWWDAVNFRFIPTIPGNYLFTFSTYARLTQAIAGADSFLFKNGAALRYLDGVPPVGDVSASFLSGTSGVVPMNGTTDYAEIFMVDDQATSVIGAQNGANGDKTLFEIRYLGQ